MENRIKTQNEVYGFHGTIAFNFESPADAFHLAAVAIMDATACEADDARAFLDGRSGRHFADEVAGFLLAGKGIEEAIAAAIAAWRGWKMDRKSAKTYDVPAGVPYLDGWVRIESMVA